ncbi:hypothetical protein GB937_006381 [Aspergillus fischeri]|nr:hypothetical protein GB937_006381 [Aspergillus fischeri]
MQQGPRSGEAARALTTETTPEPQSGKRAYAPTTKTKQEPRSGEHTPVDSTSCPSQPLRSTTNSRTMADGASVTSARLAEAEEEAEGERPGAYALLLWTLGLCLAVFEDPVSLSGAATRMLGWLRRWGWEMRYPYLSLSSSLPSSSS